jgi:hypothetical protein
MTSLIRRFIPLLAVLWLVWGAALAQHPLTGSYFEAQNGFFVVFEERGEQVQGFFLGASGWIPIELQVGAGEVMGVFSIEGAWYGMQARLAQNGHDLELWLFQLDAQRVPVQGSAEQYLAVRQDLPQGVTLPQPQASPAPANPLGQAQPAQPENPLSPSQPAVNPLSPREVGPQNPLAPGGTGQTGLVGIWQGRLELDGIIVISFSAFYPDGTYREEAYIGEEQVAFEEGRYTLSADGTLEMVSLNRSPQICFQGQCAPNDGPTTNTGRVVFQGSDTAVVTFTDEAQGAPVTVTYQRIGNANPGN